MPSTMQFDLPKDQSSIIKVIGVGGGGCNAVNHMFHQGIQGVNFAICNTDAQAMELSPVPNQIQLGPSLTEGRGAGNNPETGREATEESLDNVKELLQSNTKMVFVTAGMGGGTGTGGAPVIAKLAKEMGILTVGIVSEPFHFEGPKRLKQAEEGVTEMRKYVDTVLVISNDKLREIYGNLAFSKAFANADEVLATAAKGIAEIITVPGYVNVDFEDVKAVMVDSGVAIMGSAMAEGEDRATQSVSGALASPLLADNEIKGAKHILLNITSGTEEVLMDEISEITEYVQEAAGHDAELIWGNCVDESIEGGLLVTVIATGFEEKKKKTEDEKKQDNRVVFELGEEEKESNPGRLNRKNEEKASGENAMKLTNKDETEEQSKDEPEKQLQNQFTFEFDQPRNNKEHQEDDMQLHTREVKGEQKEEQKGEKKEEQQVEKKEEPRKRYRPPWKAEGHSEEQKRQESNHRDEHNERIKKLRGLSRMHRDKRNVEDMEREPAFKRKNVELNDPPKSNEESYSRYSLDEEAKLRKNNPYLHDRAD